MQIAGFPLDNQLFLAPMAGVSDLPYRRLMKRFGAALVFTEMVSAEGLVRDGRRTRELLSSLPEERPLAIQLFGSDPATLARAAALVRDDGELLDLNLGCPVTKVVRSGAGSALLREPVKVGQIVAAVRRATDRPLTVKIRSGWDSHSLNYLEIARIAVAEGVDAVTLHPRTRAQGFEGRADWDQIRRLKAALPVPVIGSGDLFCAEDVLGMLEITGCDAVMIGRGGYGNPWLFRETLDRQAGRPVRPVRPAERQAVALMHLEMFLEAFSPTRAGRELRKHFAWYARGLPGAAQFRSEINRLSGIEAMRQAMEEFFAAAENSA